MGPKWGLVGLSQGCVKEEGEQHWVGGGVDRARGGCGQGVRGRAGCGGLASRAPWSTCTGGTKVPWPVLGSCSVKYWTVQAQELRSLSKSLYPLKRW